MSVAADRPRYKIGVIAPIAWRTPPRAYGPWEQVASNMTEGLVAAGHKVTLFATADSLTSAILVGTVPAGYEEDRTLDAKVCEYTHLGQVFERAGEFDILHSHFDFMPLPYSRLVDTPLVTTIHGFSSGRILPLYRRYDDRVHYVSISDADRHPSLHYAATVYNGIDVEAFGFGESPDGPKAKYGRYLLYFGRMHPNKGPHDAIEIARRTGRRLLMAGLIQDAPYWDTQVAPHVDGDRVIYLGNIGPEERRQVLAEADALLHPISFEEPFGLSVAESMISGTPVIAYRRGSMPELIVEGVSGFLVNDLDGACAAVAKTEGIDRGACAAYAKTKFSRATMVQGYEAVYAAVLSS